MPRKIDRHAAILNKLRNVVTHLDSDIVAGRRLAVERWVKTYMRQIEYLKDDKLQFLCNIFCDESCWSGIRLNNAILGQKLTAEKINGIDNPLSRYDMACRYCTIDKIPQLFQEQLKSYKSSFPAEELDDDNKPAKSNDKYVRNELLGYMKGQDPVLTFWIDKKSGEFKKHENAVEGFKKAVEFKWSEGVEYFYSLLSRKSGDKEIIHAITILSSIQCNHNGAVILDFCLSKMSDQAKSKLLRDSSLLKKDKGIYSLLSALIRQSFFDTIQVILPMFKDKVLEDKILSPHDYALLLSSLSDMVLENSGLSAKAREIIMDVVRCGNFNNHEGHEEKAAVFFSNGRIPVKRAIAGLIVDWKLSNEVDNTVKKKKILEILQFAKEFCSIENFISFRRSIVDNLKIVSRSGMKRNIDYSKLAEKLFIELDRASLSCEGGDIGGAGDLGSTLSGAGVSSFSGHSK